MMNLAFITQTQRAKMMYWMPVDLAWILCVEGLVPSVVKFRLDDEGFGFMNE